MSQSEMHFGVFATPSANHARRLNSPPVPDADGLFDADGVYVICRRRQCSFDFASDLLGHVQYKEKRIQLVAIAPGRWDPAAILSACTRPHGNKVYEVDTETAKTKNWGGLDEIKIARIVGANGVRPYLSRSGKHRRAENGDQIMLQRPEAQLSAGYIRVDNTPAPYATAGNPTWSFLQVLAPANAFAPKVNYAVRSSLRALEDAGLLQIILGSRGGMATAKFRWKERAYLPKPDFSLYDQDALAQIAAGAA